MNDLIFELNDGVSAPTLSTNCHPELNRLVCAAVVSREFGRLLLNNPRKALAGGYEGEKFKLTSLEKEWVLSIRATSVQDFAVQLVTVMDLNAVPFLVEHELPDSRTYESFRLNETSRAPLYATRDA